MMLTPTDGLNDLLQQPAYALPDDEKKQVLLPIIRDQLEGAIKNNHHLPASSLNYTSLLRGLDAWKMFLPYLSRCSSILT